MHVHKGLLSSYMDMGVLPPLAREHISATYQGIFAFFRRPLRNAWRLVNASLLYSGQCLSPVFTFLGQTFLALSIMSWHKRDWGVVSLIESRVSSGPVDHPQTAKSLENEMHFLDFIHSLWKAQKWAFNVKNIIKDICNTATLALPSKRKKWFFCSVLVSPRSWTTNLGKTGRRH